MASDELRAGIDETLVEWLPAGLKAAIDDALAEGADPGAVLVVVRRKVERIAAGDPNKGRLTLAAVEAYLESRGMQG